MFKDIISHQEGQNLFPGIPTYIKGTPTGTPLTTENVKGPMIGVTADGAFNMYPGQQIGTLGKGVLEIPLKQMGGSQQDMIMKLIMAFAQSRGQDPNEIMTKLKQLPQDQQQQAIQAIAQTMQEEMMQQQQMQQQQMMQQPMGQQPMAQHGTQVEKSTTDRLKDAYIKTLPYSISQSQQQPMQSIDWNNVGNSIGRGLNQFMKTSPLGPLFSAPVILPPDLYPQEQYLGEGGQPCFDCYDNYNPSPQAQNLNWFYKAQGGTAFPAANRYPESWVGYNGTAYAQGGMTEAYPQANVYPHMYPDGGSTEPYSSAQTYLPYDRPGETTPNFMVEYGGQTIDDIYQMMKKGGLNVDAKKKKGGELSQESFAKYLMKNGGFPQKIQRSPYYNYGMTAPEAAAIMGQSTKSPFLKKLAAGINIAGAFNTLAGDPLGMDRAYIGRNGGVLPKHQITGTTGTSWTPPAAFQGVNQFMPAPMQMETAEDMGWDAYNRSNPMASYESYLGANQTSTAAGDPVSFRPGSTADPANPNYQAPAGAESMKPKQKKQRGDIIGSMRVTAGIGAAGSLLASAKEEEERRKREGKINTTDRAFQVNKDIDRGDYLTNVTQGPSFRPDQYAYAQKNVGYTDQSPLYNQGKFGGAMPELRDGMEIDLSMYPKEMQDEIIYSIYAAGGSVEYI